MTGEQQGVSPVNHLWTHGTWNKQAIYWASTRCQVSFHLSAMTLLPPYILVKGWALGLWQQVQDIDMMGHQARCSWYPASREAQNHKKIVKKGPSGLTTKTFDPPRDWIYVSHQTMNGCWAPTLLGWPLQPAAPTFRCHGFFLWETTSLRERHMDVGSHLWRIVEREWPSLEASPSLWIADWDREPQWWELRWTSFLTAWRHPQLGASTRVEPV